MQAGDGIPFGQYRLLRRLARGGMAEVFLARQVGPAGFDRIVALKRILPHLVDSADFVRMFLDEARVAARLQHPNIAHIYEFGRAGEHYFIAMEYVAGIHAGTLIKAAASDPLPCALVARIGADACAALHHAHTLRDEQNQPLALVHRDVSPPNLLLSCTGTVKLVDFGIAKAVNLAADQTRPGVVKGKFAYLSPEQTVGRRLDGRSDVFSLAVVLWELLAGRVIVSRADPVEAMRAIRDGNLPDIQTVRADVPDILAWTLRSALAVDREQRSTAAGFGRALESFIKSCPELGTSMQLAEWIGARFPPAGTSGHHATLGDGGRAPDDDTAATMRTVPRPALGPRLARAAAGVLTGGRARADSQPGSGPATAMAGELGPPTSPVNARSGRLAIIASAALFAGVALYTVPDLLDDEDLLRDRTAAVHRPPPAPPAPRVSRLPATEPTGPSGASAATRPASVLEVITVPAGARAVLGGDIRTTPARFEELPAGTHHLRIDRPGFHPVERSLELQSGQHLVIELPLAHERDPERGEGGPAAPSAGRGRLTIRTRPHSEVFLGDRKLGTTPFADLELSAGTHQLSFRHPGRPPHRRAVTIRPGHSTRLDFALPR